MKKLYYFNDNESKAKCPHNVRLYNLEIKNKPKTYLNQLINIGSTYCRECKFHCKLGVDNKLNKNIYYVICSCEGFICG